MGLYLVHHGDAVGPDIDVMRPLSARGRHDTERVAQEAARRKARPDAIWHSGKLRARQTAEIFWRACNPLAAFSASRGLQPEDPPAWIRDQLEAETRSIMIVGHMPHLPRLFDLLRGDDGVRERHFPQHGCVALARDQDGWKELWRVEAGPADA